MSDRRSQRRAQIARAAIEPLSRLGVRHASLAQIGATMDMSAAHLLYYFPSKTALFLEALRVVEEDLRAAIAADAARVPTARERWRLLVDAASPAGVHDSNLLLWLEAWTEAVHDSEVREAIAALEAAWQATVADILRHGVATGELPASLDVDGLVEGFSALLDGLTIRAVVGHRPLTKADVVRIADEIMGPHLTWRDAPDSLTATTDTDTEEDA
ncbi:TetR/AcrR family transcriptional regulator [Demequina salsinemoris]|uniref:TetR/AcrR family transcriptional regulator n=1 Tax=Demequina salsinemoris TaxID=577470 RepID=UPI00078646B5|nr:TetR family transcriptional regulator C-terminal domain-containing protein [Demequina salsinemoris]